MKVFDDKKFILFWSYYDYLSNFYRCNIFKYGMTFIYPEQLFMYEKAMLFGDVSSMNEISMIRSLKEIKNLNVTINGFDQKIWDSKKFGILVSIIIDKFSQNPRLLKFLLDPKYDDFEYVNATKYDNVLGIGINPSNPDALDKGKWLGENLLGKAINVAKKVLKVRLFISY